MENIGCFILGLASACWVFAMMMGMVAAWPYGGIGLIATVAIGFQLAKVIKARLENKKEE